MIYLTEKASNKVIELSEEDDVGHNCIRVRVVGGGCSGMTNDMNFDNKISESDEVFEINNVKIIIDQISFMYLDETTIDWIETPMGGGFKFLNPNVKSSCGCGSSYSV